MRYDGCGGGETMKDGGDEGDTRQQLTHINGGSEIVA